MFVWFFLAVLALLAFPVIAIVALVKANEARGLIRLLDSRVNVLERGSAAAGALPSQPTAEPAPLAPPGAGAEPVRLALVQPALARPEVAPPEVRRLLVRPPESA